MRSRYSAFVKKEIFYINDTMRGEALKGFDPKDLIEWLESVHWINLKVLSSQALSPNKAYVSFIATYENNGEQFQIAEKSKFEKIEGRWYYVKGLPLRQ